MRTQTTTALGFVLANVFAGAALAHPGHARMPDGFRPLSSSAPDLAGETSYAKGKRLLAAGDFAGAMTTFRQALVEQPGSADILNGLAVSYARMGRPDLALPYYAAAVGIDEKEILGSYSAAVDIQESAADLVLGKKLPGMEIVTHRFSLGRIQEALDLAARPTAESLKILITHA